MIGCKKNRTFCDLSLSYSNFWQIYKKISPLIYLGMHFSCKLSVLLTGGMWGGMKRSDFSDDEKCAKREGRSMPRVQTSRHEHFRTCSQACLCDSRNPARPALELSFLPVKRKAELKSAFRNCAPSRKHPQGGKCKHALIECVVHQGKGRWQKRRILELRKRKRER